MTILERGRIISGVISSGSTPGGMNKSFWEKLVSESGEALEVLNVATWKEKGVVKETENGGTLGGIGEWMSEECCGVKRLNLNFISIVFLFSKSIGSLKCPSMDIKNFRIIVFYLMRKSTTFTNHTLLFFKISFFKTSTLIKILICNVIHILIYISVFHEQSPIKSLICHI